MKAKPETTLFRVLTGSHLYGNATEKSDFDYKAVVLPNLDDMLLNKKVTNRKEKPEGMKATDSMVAGESETEYLPVQVFLDDFFNGQTYALELAFAMKAGKAEAYDFGNGDVAAWMWSRFMGDYLVTNFLTSNVKKMVGYAVAQSRLYGLKTERFTSVKKFQAEVERFFSVAKDMETKTLASTPWLLEEVLKLDFVNSTVLLNAKGGYADAPALDVAGKKFPLTNTWATVHKSMQRTLDDYGARVREFDGEGVDWKALSHALRITEQVLELSEFGTLTFPRPNAEYLRKVKNGELSLAEATEALDAAFAKVDLAVENSVLQERTPELEEKFTAFKVQTLRLLYQLPLKT